MTEQKPACSVNTQQIYTAKTMSTGETFAIQLHLSFFIGCLFNYIWGGLPKSFQCLTDNSVGPSQLFGRENISVWCKYKKKKVWTRGGEEVKIGRRERGGGYKEGINWTFFEAWRWVSEDGWKARGQILFHTNCLQVEVYREFKLFYDVTFLWMWLWCVHVSIEEASNAQPFLCARRIVGEEKEVGESIKVLYLNCLK